MRAMMKIKLLVTVFLGIALHCVSARTVEKTDQSLSVSGVVTDRQGEPLPGILVSVKNTKITTVTDDNGKYQLRLLSSSAMLVFSGMAYMEQEREVKAGSVVNISLSESIKNMDEVLVIGYGEQTRSDLTGAITSIKSDEIE